eukprot:7016447-Alexandrium_andersonii.AAC.1
MDQVMISPNPSGAIEQGRSLTNPESGRVGALIEDRSRLGVAEGRVRVGNQVTGSVFLGLYRVEMEDKMVDQ